jgi:hypothetical protein
MGCSRVFDWVLPDQQGHTGFSLSLFFYQLSLIPAPGRHAGPVSKLCLKE